MKAVLDYGTVRCGMLRFIRLETKERKLKDRIIFKILSSYPIERLSVLGSRTLCLATGNHQKFVQDTVEARVEKIEG
jgi:hypothetical protein